MLFVQRPQDRVVRLTAAVLLDRCYHDLLVGPKRYGCGGPPCFARLVARVIPQPDLCIVLDVSPT